MKMIATLFVVFAFASSALGDCPVPPTVPGADIDKIAGRWYETVKILPNDTTIITLDFTLREDRDFNLTIHSVFSKHDEFVLAKRTDNQNVLNFTTPLKIRYQNTFNIADTDYDSYLVAYSCFIFPHHSAIHSRMILSRNETMSADKLAELTDLANKIGVSSNRVAPKIH